MDKVVAMAASLFLIGALSLAEKMDVLRTGSLTITNGRETTSALKKYLIT
jgi:hypothetical protein